MNWHIHGASPGLNPFFTPWTKGGRKKEGRESGQADSTSAEAHIVPTVALPTEADLLKPKTLNVAVSVKGAGYTGGGSHSHAPCRPWLGGVQGVSRKPTPGSQAERPGGVIGRRRRGLWPCGRARPRRAGTLVAQPAGQPTRKGSWRRERLSCLFLQLNGVAEWRCRCHSAPSRAKGAGRANNMAQKVPQLFRWPDNSQAGRAKQ